MRSLTESTQSEKRIGSSMRTQTTPTLRERLKEMSVWRDEGNRERIAHRSQGGTNSPERSDPQK